jgi:hypothetical protein
MDLFSRFPMHTFCFFLRLLQNPVSVAAVSDRRPYLPAISAVGDRRYRVLQTALPFSQPELPLLPRPSSRLRFDATSKAAGGDTC